MLNPVGCDPIYYGKMVILVCAPFAHQDINHPYPDTQCMVFLPTKPGSLRGKSRQIQHRLSAWDIPSFLFSWLTRIVSLKFREFSSDGYTWFLARRWELPSFPWQCDKHRNPTSSATAEVVKGRFWSPKKVGRLREVCHWVISSISHPAVYSCIGEKDIVGEPTHGG